MSWAGNLIRIARADAGLSQRELARRAKTSQATLSAYEAGRKAPTLDTLERIIRAAGFDLRIVIEPHDDHDEWVAEFERSVDPKDVARWRALKEAVARK